MATFHSVFEESVRIDTGLGSIVGAFGCPERAWGAVVFADGCGSDGHPLRDAYLAETLQQLGLATLEVDLLRLAEETCERCISKRSFDFRLMSARLHTATDWLNQNSECIEGDFRIGYVGTSLGAAAALRAAAQRTDVEAVVSCGGRPDMAGRELSHVKAATLMIVDDDPLLIESNQAAYEQLTQTFRREVTVLHEPADRFDQQSVRDEASQLIRRWFVRYLGAAASRIRKPR
jgi:putative phosphoribosyl transferase